MPAEDRYIVLSAKKNRRTTAQQVANQFLAASGKQISRKTVARRLRGGGLYARRPVVCVPLTRQHRTARLQWCREHHNWTEQDWACVLFSDERIGPGAAGNFAGRNYPPTNKNILIVRALTEEWDKLPQQLLDNVNSCWIMLCKVETRQMNPFLLGVLVKGKSHDLTSPGLFRGYISGVRVGRTAFEEQQVADLQVVFLGQRCSPINGEQRLTGYFQMRSVRSVWLGHSFLEVVVDRSFLPATTAVRNVALWLHSYEVFFKYRGK
ncbi:transposable element Tcb2 transposase [Trichonephila clavipes]|nr:transposable element Tcb2 transposase [Trichonephila clavipes]